MKTTKLITIVATLIGLGAISATSNSIRSSYGWGGEGDSSVTLTIKADGSCGLSSETTQPRKMLEYQIRARERYAKMAEGMEDEDASDKPSEPAKESEAKSFSDDELIKKIHEMYESQSEFTGEDGNGKIETLEVTTNSVRMVWARPFGSLSELMGIGLWSWGPTVLMVEDARFETNTNGQFQISFTPSKVEERYLKIVPQQLKARKMKQGWKLVLPGKIVSSSLPETKDNATWLALDTSKPESVDALLKLIGTNITIVAESGGLKLEAALDAKTAMRAARRGGRGQSDLPITEAGPGFVAEPVSITVSTIYHFPGSVKDGQNQSSYSSGMQSTGTVIAAKLFPPKGRSIQSVSDVRVLKAKDDKGRSIADAKASESEEEDNYSHTTYSFDDSDRTGAARLELRLGLPSPDAQTIEEVEAEGIVHSIGGWKEMTLPSVQGDEKKEIDLGELVPGAKLVITKITAQRNQTTVQARLLGPTEVGQLDVKIKLTGQGSSNLSERRNTTTGKKTTRTVTIQAYEYNSAGGSANATPTLILRLPQDAKRERVKFKLTALDLL